MKRNIERAIIRALLLNNELGVSKLAEICGCSRSCIYSALERLLDSGAVFESASERKYALAPLPTAVLLSLHADFAELVGLCFAGGAYRRERIDFLPEFCTEENIELAGRRMKQYGELLCGGSGSVHYCVICESATDASAATLRCADAVTLRYELLAENVFPHEEGALLYINAEHLTSFLRLGKEVFGDGRAKSAEELKCSLEATLKLYRPSCLWLDGEGEIADKIKAICAEKRIRLLETEEYRLRRGIKLKADELEALVSLLLKLKKI